ncbi:MAG: alanine racemase [Novosphingobium sp. 28-62-57]|uniref:alanine racemase n=1 Tax=unclassified Novosphingobium TaxID=2644732 RepID=UPI000BD4AD57|nr:MULTISPECIES: alanine racemase [unclassified Novosphingobium]OYW48615.1 MAG: alanine racemase [Novosphingobium sp. 12-62-10]OYZ10168.1 MAG: alanine racemase [Novosphingobium sp. 28-62-57]OZA38114.1 MAG: alanine racemase [Novosphingobium sp. 17-62-9]HQS69023.1 alanine racemase [Novosphingobium sp.]
MMQRRGFLTAGAGLAAVASARALAAPVLSASNHGLTPAKAQRRNGWIEIDAAAFEANIDAVRAWTGPTRLCAVMKADAYGNGIALLIPSILRKKITDVAITANDEARVARALGYKGRLIRIRTATPEEMEDAFSLRVEESLGNVEAAALLEKLWRKRSRRDALPVHLALNAGGMSRNGIELSTAYGKADARALLALKGLSFRGAMTHYPSEEAEDILGQFRRYQEDVAWLQGEGLNANGLLRHTANTFAALKHPETRLDMVRIGGAIYGDPGSYKTDRFVQTMTIKSRVAAVNHYPAGQTVNYDRTYRLERESWLANIPIGYSDGLRRSFSHANRPEFPAEMRNQTQVLIRGQRFPVVGRVTMNTLMVDVTGLQDSLRLDDEVVLFGGQGAQRITQAEFETNGSAYGPEMLAVLGATLPRVLKGS